MNDTIFDYAAAAPRLAASGVSGAWIAIIVVSVLVIILFVAMLLVVRRALSRPELRGLSREVIQARWGEIETIAESGMMGAKMAVVEADKLLDAALKSLMMPGETMGDRLRFAGYKYPELRKVWFAHKLRNQLVHETTFELSHAQAKSALHAFKHALKTINVL